MTWSLNKVKSIMNFKKHKFQKKDYSGIIPVVDAGEEEMHMYVQYEVSMGSPCG